MVVFQLILFLTPNCFGSENIRVGTDLWALSSRAIRYSLKLQQEQQSLFFDVEGGVGQLIIPALKIWTYLLARPLIAGSPGALVVWRIPFFSLRLGAQSESLSTLLSSSLKTTHLWETPSSFPRPEQASLQYHTYKKDNSLFVHVILATCDIQQRVLYLLYQQ